MVIHRDIKSANILLNADWKAKISDFGLSAITAINQEVISKLVGTIGYVDPVYEITGFFTEKSDIYSLGVVLFEILYGQLLVPNTKDYDQQRVRTILKHIHEERKIGLKDYEIWGPKLPKDYEEIIKLSKSSGIYSTTKKKDLYNRFSKGILLQDDKVWFSLGSNSERNEMISARKFSFINRSPHKWKSVPESRFKKFAPSEVNGKKQLMLSAKAALYNFSNAKLFTSKPSSQSRLGSVLWGISSSSRTLLPSL
ncbi:hypothetical protein L1987_86949 [Smallanthus sonchifolius]|uniref:Uncharacterized protein n=1 Tax=Smallanthus sonchifolius TaxID=185202 RepID=A0ACB8Y185_9ASTR|nr:hypothetical protein L1987_86949 [Smallanthus sonchifolius]